jgi:signal peptidase I
MLRILLSVLFLFFILLSSKVSFAQKFIAIDKPGHIKRIKFYVGDEITFFDIDKLHIKGKIEFIKDSSFIINNQEVLIENIVKVKNTKKNFGLKLLANISFLAGTGYFFLDSGNRLLNSEKVIFYEKTIKSSSIMLGVSFLSLTFSNNYIRINEKHPIKIIDINI